jgi:hypothetical protein
MPWPLYNQLRTLVPIEQKSGWVPEAVWMFSGKENLLLMPELKPQIFQPVPSCYTDYAIPAPVLQWILKKQEGEGEGKHGLDSSGLGQEPVERSSTYSKEHLCSIKFGEFLDYVRNY